MVKRIVGCFKGRKRGGYSFKLGGLLLLMAALLLCSAPAAVAAEETVPAASDGKTAPCKGLKPFNNIDELLYQFYINLDSDCLFMMSVEELEKVWDIKILSKERAPKPGEYALLRDSVEFYHKHYKSEKDAFFIEIYPGWTTGKNVFNINITRYYYEMHATLFPDGNYPKLLPVPLEKFSLKLPSSGLAQDNSMLPRIVGKYMMDSYEYYWLNSAKTSIIYLTGFHGVTGIMVMNHVSPGYIQQNTGQTH